MEAEIQQENSSEDIFKDYVEYTKASQGARFLNYLIDNLFMQFALSYASGYVIGYLLSVIAPGFLDWLAFEGESSLSYLLLSYIIGILNYLVYYTFCELAFKGYTLGKVITGTKAIREDGNALTFRDAILRSLSRLVPFEPFSALGGTPWHDSWTKTTVIKAR